MPDNIITVTPEEVKVNANHLAFVPDEILESVIQDVYTVYIGDYAVRWKNNASRLAKLKVIEKLLAQHMATLNVRRADSESAAGMSKSISVPKDKDLDQTEYGQMAKRLAKNLGLDWANDDLLPASIVIY